ncbi:hypothetical protein O3M35_006811 [Rhynocoris fuscipes]|uniref:Uncharacterized protein n=1 Tax=Rhynocoris fuscipes TaxID=488301 RepID=A0AAW1DFD5_9HEMI
MDNASFYNDFISYLNDNMVKVQEFLEKVTTMHYEATKILMDTCTLFHPQILIELNEIEANGKKYDNYILSAQQLKTKLTNLCPKSNNNEEDYREIMEEIGLLCKEIETLLEDNLTAY